MLLTDLIKKVKRKDRQAQADLYEMFKRTWFTICLRYNRDRDDAADVLQNALVKIYSNLYQFNQDKGSFKSWSAKIVVNENLQFLRSKKNEISFEEVEGDVGFLNQDEDVERLSSEELTAMIQKLPVGYRTVFNLYVIDGLSHHEISDVLNISLGTSKSQLFKARKMLKQKLEILI